MSRAWMSHTLWHLGYPGHALTRSHEALALAEAHAHPFSQAIALAYAVMLHQFRREQHTVYAHADTALALCTEQGFAYYLGWVTIIQGWSSAVQGQREAGIEQMRQGLAALQSTGAKRAYHTISLCSLRGMEQSGRRTRDSRPCRGLCRSGNNRRAPVGGRVVSTPGRTASASGRPKTEGAGDTGSVFPSGS